LVTLAETIQVVRGGEHGAVVKILVGGRALAEAQTSLHSSAPTDTPPIRLPPSPKGICWRARRHELAA